MIDTVLFDLDGTLADTAPDLADALNKTLVEEQRAPLPFETIRPVVSHGGKAMIKLAFNLGPEDHDYERLRQRFLDIYLANIALKTRLFEGMEAFLNEIEARGMRWGVVTNKPSWLTDPLMEAMNLHRRASTIISGDTAAHSKPHPEPMFLACAQSGSDPAKCVYIGDAERDIEAGRAAGMKTLVAMFGYIQEHDIPAQWGADALIEHPAQAWTFIEQW